MQLVTYGNSSLKNVATSIYADQALNIIATEDVAVVFSTIHIVCIFRLLYEASAYQLTC